MSINSQTSLQWQPWDNFMAFGEVITELEDCIARIKSQDKWE